MSSLNDISYQKIKNYLDQWQTSSEIVGPAIIGMLPWNSELVDEINKKLLDEEVSEALVFRLCSWRSFLWIYFSDDPQKGEDFILLPAKTFQLSGVIDFVLQLISRRVKIPYIYWSDIAPQLVSEIRRYYYQDVGSMDDFLFENFRHVELDKKKQELETRPETKVIFEEWSRDHMFS